MRRIAIVGAGQSGLQLAFALLDQGYHVTLATNRDAESIRSGRVMSSQCMFHSALQIERDLGLNHWEESCPSVEGISLTLVSPDGRGAKAFEWSSRLTRYAQSVDQRLKMSAWLLEVERRGAHVQLGDVGIPELEALAQSHDLVLLAAGKGDIVNLFGRDATRSAFDRPQRALALTYVTGMTPSTPYSRVRFNLLPGIGEYFVFPALTLSGPCEIMVFEGIPGGPLDCWGDVQSPEQHLERSLSIVRQYLPWEAERCRNVELSDANGTLSGRFTPCVRNPSFRLPSGRAVFGMADAVVVNDPITGQGSNSAAKCASVYLDAILAHESAPFGEDWMQATFERYWSYAQHVVRWTNSLLTPPPPHLVDLLGAASTSPSLAARIVNAFDDPREFSPWWFDPQACSAEIREHLACAA
ncbi:styrene monooxygenase/indole monooxygenase family protein [Burkholderia glumae]|uniref:styrene monooxygenase/indole monooxygenase family protein n=1 Tax=Burkholderia glumae TaxID=337 RepID=UPI001462A8BB|nr:styrene monooxygenase/indole monooxygenase family protein [Burkholderia glumae]QJP69530.1 FAD-binding oxidoreductase [Burkholderia glumae]